MFLIEENENIVVKVVDSIKYKYVQVLLIDFLCSEEIVLPPILFPILCRLRPFPQN